MTPITVAVALAERSYPILIGESLLAGEGGAQLRALAAGRQVAVVTNETVAQLHAPAVEAVLAGVAAAQQRIVLPDGEAHKDWSSLNRIFDALLAQRFDRHCLLIALGGGVVGDVAGFAAATYQRGANAA